MNTNVFLSNKSFSRGLIGKAVFLKGKNTEAKLINGTFLINSIDNNEGKIHLINSNGKFTSLHHTDFTHSDEPIKLFLLK